MASPEIGWARPPRPLGRFRREVGVRLIVLLGVAFFAIYLCLDVADAVKHLQAQRRIDRDLANAPAHLVTMTVGREMKDPQSPSPIEAFVIKGFETHCANVPPTFRQLRAVSNWCMAAQLDVGAIGSNLPACKNRDAIAGTYCTRGTVAVRVRAGKVSYGAFSGVHRAWRYFAGVLISHLLVAFYTPMIALLAGVFAGVLLAFVYQKGD